MLKRDSDRVHRNFPAYASDSVALAWRLLVGFFNLIVISLSKSDYSERGDSTYGQHLTAYATLGNDHDIY
jgi:hypothetical protein